MAGFLKAGRYEMAFINLPPTYNQEQYAQHLVDKLRKCNNIHAERCGRKVLDCQTRVEMSKLISEMVRLVNECEQEFGDTV